MFDQMVDYLDPAVTDRFIAITYEESKKRLAPYWGTTLKGFFGDETSFENFDSYDVLFGEDTPCLPWTRRLAEKFREEYGYDLLDWADLLWSEGAAADTEGWPPVRYDYMNLLTRLFSEGFFGRIQAWCHKNGVSFIGHVIEDNRAHMHHGYGVGHFFRATRHFDMGGYDFVLRQLDSEQKRTPYEERYPQFKIYRDEPYPTFFHFTLPKLAQSAAHLELGTDLVMCENFGAYGWDLGLREMKWLTDWMTARGTNWYVPHAFSPLFPDPDCPPHFYANGRNPQWPYFRLWADYANRSCLLLKDAVHVAPIAVLYPAESHWCGDRDLLDETCRALTEHQYDYDILSCDLLADSARCLIEDGELRIGRESFRAIVLPGVETLPLAAARRLAEFASAGGIVLEVGAHVAKECRGLQEELKATLPVLDAVTLEELPDALSERGIEPTAVRSGDQPYPDLRICRYRHGDCDVLFFSNEGVESALVDEWLVPEGVVAELWHPMDGRIEAARLHSAGADGSGRVLPLRLEPYEAVFVVLRHSPADPADRADRAAVVGAKQNDVGVLLGGTAEETRLLTDWRMTGVSSPLKNAEELARLHLAASGIGMGNWLNNPELADFSGTVVYETELELEPGIAYTLDLGDVGEIADVSVGGEPLAPRICPPYRWELPSLPAGNVRIRVAVTNTLGAALRDEAFRRSTPAPSGLLGPVNLTIRGLVGHA
ncbi:hypothetical protein E6C55_19445 [Cohnella fermenti]|uniref:Glycosyl transferase family 2 n=2 Tax=Cohnella fermenti TaxID=2565925 RepID=A0A4S4BQ46_9BACL|nr:hypothetical protein E6C55_19445 [Cohnella fermenti]